MKSSGLPVAGRQLGLPKLEGLTQQPRLHKAAQAAQGMQRLGRHRGHCALSRETHHLSSSRLEHFQISEGESGKKVHESTKLS